MIARFFLCVLVITIGVSSAHSRVFDTEDQYVTAYGPNINKGAPAPPPFKFALFLKKQIRILVLFESLVSQGEIIVKQKSRFTEADVTGMLAANQGSSSWKKENVETTKDPNVAQMSAWSRKDGKLFAGFFPNASPPFLMIGTRRGADFLIKQKDNLSSYVKQ